MNLNTGNRFRMRRPLALLVTASMAMPLLTGCGGKKEEASAPPPPVDDTRGGTMTPNAPNMAPKKEGMSTTKKVIILAGAAAAYYWYTHHKKAEENADKQQYYISKSTGQIYYRDPKTHQAHFVTPPKDNVQVDETEAQNYKRFQGYNNQPTGDNLKAAADGE